MEKLVIKGKTYEHIKTRVYTPISVYKGTDSFIRIGQVNLIHEELRQHKNLLSSGFPIAEIMDEGVWEDKYYYIEKSLGNETFSQLFRADYENLGEISEINFKKFLTLVETFATAQLKTANKKDYWAEFEKSRSIDLAIEELPDLKDKILQAVEMAKSRLTDFPYVLTHGDFNPYNLFEKGVIDMKGVAYGPAGFDLISNIYHIRFFPKVGDYEYIRKFEFTKDQVSEYLTHIDRIYSAQGLPELSKFADDFLLFRMTWSAVKMHYAPKIQQWRYELLKKIFDVYLKGGSIAESLQ